MLKFHFNSIKTDYTFHVFLGLTVAHELHQFSVMLRRCLAVSFSLSLCPLTHSPSSVCQACQAVIRILLTTICHCGPPQTTAHRPGNAGHL